MKTFLLLIGVALIIGCANFSTNLFRTEQVAVGAAYTAYEAYTNALASGTLKISETESNNIKAARLNFAASVGMLEAFRTTYVTNSTPQTKALAQSALDAVLLNSSNLVWLVHHIEGK